MIAVRNNVHCDVYYYFPEGSEEPTAEWILTSDGELAAFMTSEKMTLSFGKEFLGWAKENAHRIKKIEFIRESLKKVCERLGFKIMEK